MTLYFAIFQHWFTLLWRLVSGMLFHHAMNKAFRRRGVHRLAVKTYRPAKPRRSGGRPKPAHVLEEVLSLHAAGHGSHRTIAAEFNRMHACDGVTVCPTTVRDWIRKHATEMAAVRSATRNRVPRHVPANRCWGVDATGKKDVDGVSHFIFGIIDHGTRLNIELKQIAEKTSAALLREVLRCVDEYGKPRRVRTDNASLFRCPVFSAGLAALGIEHVFSEPGKPWQNPRIERLFLTLKEKLNLLQVVNGSELQELLDEFRFWYNEIRPHQNLFGHTPGEVWRGVNPYRCRPTQASYYAGWGGLLAGWNLRR